VGPTPAGFRLRDGQVVTRVNQSEVA